MAKDNESTKDKVARIDGRTESLLSEIKGVNEHLKTQNATIFKHETRLSTTEEKSKSNEKAIRDINKNLNRLFIAIIAATITMLGGSLGIIFGAF